MVWRVTCKDAVKDVDFKSASKLGDRLLDELNDLRNHDPIYRSENLKAWIAAANRDPKVFEDPQALDFDRRQEQNATFGPSLDHRIGHFLAKMQLAEFFSALLDGYEIELTRGPELVYWGRNGTCR